MLCSNEERQAKRIRVATFVDNFLSSLQSTASTQDVRTAIESTRSKLCSGTTTTAQAIKDARRQLGQSDESYLQLSVMVLWSGEDSDENHLLYPASANTERDMNESTLRSMARVAEDDYNHILKQLEFAKSHFAYYLAIPEIRIWMFQFVNTKKHQWYIDEFLKILGENMDISERIDTFTEQETLLKEDRFNRVDIWSTMVDQAMDDDTEVGVLFEAFSLICDPYQDVILDGLFCVKNDSLKACDLQNKDECDELMILSNTTLSSRYQNTVFFNHKNLETFDIDANTDSVFRASFAFFDDDLEYCKTRQVPALSDLKFKDFKELIESTRLAAWLHEERVSIESGVVSEQQLIELCSSQTQLRAFSSCFLSISRGLTCSVPPYMLSGLRPSEDPYSLPMLVEDTNNALTSIDEVGVEVKWSQPGKIVSMWQLVYDYSKLLQLDSTSVKSRNSFVKCLWTPTVVKGVNSSTPTVGNVAINKISLATSYCTMLSEIHKSFNRSENGVESKFVQAVCKLEMLSSLRVLNQYQSKHIQSLISSDGVDQDRLINLFWFHSNTTNDVGKPTGVMSADQFEQCATLQAEDAGINGCLKDWDYRPTPKRPYQSDSLIVLEELNYRSTTNLVPAFASMDDVRMCVDLIYRWKYNSDARARLKHIKTRVTVLKESYQELLTRGRQDYSSGKPKSDVEERERRNAIWSDSLRELDISGDRFYRFLKDVAGTLHEDVTSLIDLQDRSMEQNQRIYREQRRETLRQINSFSQRVMDTVISSVFRQSKMRADIEAVPAEKTGNTSDSSTTIDNMVDSVVVVSEDSVQKVRELADGTSGLGFLEANQALQQFLVSQQAKPLSLRELLLGMRGVLDTYRDYAIDSLQTNQMQSGRASLEYLANPRNSYVVRIKNETFAAIRSAYLLLRRQLLDTGFSYSKLPSAYDCIEGDYYEVCNQFAQLVAYQLGHSRAFSSAASVYLGATPAKLNLSMLNISLNKTCNRIRQMANNSRL